MTFTRSIIMDCHTLDHVLNIPWLFYINDVLKKLHDSLIIQSPSSVMDLHKSDFKDLF